MRASGSETDSIINLTVRSRCGQRLVDVNIPDTAQEDQETGQANLYFVSVDVPFTRNDLEPGAVTITTAGKTNGCRQRCSSSASTASARSGPPSLRRWSTSGTGSWGR